jgi:hypothetical protein
MPANTPNSYFPIIPLWLPDSQTQFSNFSFNVRIFLARIIYLQQWRKEANPQKPRLSHPLPRTEHPKHLFLLHLPNQNLRQTLHLLPKPPRKRMIRLQIAKSQRLLSPKLLRNPPLRLPYNSTGLQKPTRRKERPPPLQTRQVNLLEKENLAMLTCFVGNKKAAKKKDPEEAEEEYMREFDDEGKLVGGGIPSDLEDFDEEDDGSELNDEEFMAELKKKGFKLQSNGDEEDDEEGDEEEGDEDDFLDEEEVMAELKKKGFKFDKNQPGDEDEEEEQVKSTPKAKQTEDKQPVKQKQEAKGKEATTQQETKKQEAKPESKKQDQKKGKQDTKQQETKKQETKQPETKKQETKQPETKKSEAKQPETKKQEAKKQEIKQPETKKQETKQPETKKQEAKKQDQTKETKKQEEAKKQTETKSKKEEKQEETTDKKRKAEDSKDGESVRLFIKYTLLTTSQAKKARVCPITRSEFQEKAKKLSLTIEGQDLVLKPKVFKSKAFGWAYASQLPVAIGDKTINAQIVINIAFTV